MVLMKHYSFDMFEGLTKEMLINAPSVPMEKLAKISKQCDAMTDLYHERLRKEGKLGKQNAN